MREILQSIDVMNATGSVAALLLCCVSGGAQADQQAGVERLSTEFSTASEAPRGSYALVERDETILAVTHDQPHRHNDGSVIAARRRAQREQVTS